MEGEFTPPFWSPASMDGFILDWDGVLANTKLDFSHVRTKYFGGEIVPLIERASALPPPLDQEAKEAIVRVEMEGADRAVPVEGAAELLRWLSDNGKRWCVVSRNCADSIHLAARRCGIELPPIVMSREEDVVKPNPEALILAARRMGVPRERCIMLGDFIYDMLGARRAAVRCALVEGDIAAWGHMADAAWGTLREFVRELDAPRPRIPWEYRALAERRGSEYLRTINRIPWRVRRADGFTQALALARAGVLRIAVPVDTRLELSEWERLDIPSTFIGRPLAEALREFLPRRWPAATAVEDDGSAADAPEGQDLETLLLQRARGEITSED